MAAQAREVYCQRRLLPANWRAIVCFAAGLIWLSAISLQCQAEDGSQQHESPGILAWREKLRDPDFPEKRVAAIRFMEANRGELSRFSAGGEKWRGKPPVGFQALSFRLDYVQGDDEPVIVPDDVTDEFLAQTLPYLPEVEEVFLPYTSVTDAGLAHLANLPGLKRLDLEYGQSTEFPCHIGDDGMLSLSGLSSLEHLSLTCVPISDEGVGHLVTLDNLRHLRIWSTGKVLTSNAFCSLSRMRRLTHLHLWLSDRVVDTPTEEPVEQFLQIEDEVSRSIAALNGRLQTLTLSGRIHPRALRAIGQIDSLTSLDLTNSNVTSADLDAIVTDLERPLESLSIPQSSISLSSAATLQRKWPGLMHVDHESVTQKQFRALAEGAAPKNSGSE